MKFILNKDKLTIEGKYSPNSGSVKYYEAEVEHDENWDDLTIVAVFVEKDSDSGKSISLVDNKIYIDTEMDGEYELGFVGYTIENNEKVYQISTNLKSVKFNRGAGQIETSEQSVPTPTEWEIYVAQLQSIVDDITGLSDDLTAQVTEVETKLANGDFDGADGQDGADGITPTIGLNGNWYLGDTDTGKPSRGENGTNGTNGKDGKDGADGKDGQDGQDGQDGYSPTATVTRVTGGATISITDKNGTTTATVNDGVTQDISGKFDKSDITTSYSTTSGKVYDVTYINTTVGNIETLLSAI